MEKVVPAGTGVGVGNTEPQPKRVSAVKRYCFTYFYETQSDIDTLVLRFKEFKDMYIFGDEICPETKRKHLQGYVELNKRMRITQLKPIYGNTISWRAANGTKQENITYCTKDGKIYTNFRLPRQIKFPEMNRPWQIEILNIISKEPDNRTIHWYWERKGGIGKTTFTNYLALRHNAILCPPKTNDALHRLAKEVELNNAIDIVVFDIPRTSLDYINYTAMEKIKDGQIVSGKYEGCQAIIASPHLIVFANEPPALTKMSLDRWKVTCLD